jgi:hypothetical protein
VFDLTTFLRDSRNKSFDATRLAAPPGSANIGPTATWKSITQIPTGLLMGNKPGFKTSTSTCLATLSLDEVVRALGQKLRALFPGVKSSREMLLRCFLLVGVERGRPMLFSDCDLRGVLHHKFGMELAHKSVDNVFKALDPNKTGLIKIRQLLKLAVTNNEHLEGVPDGQLLQVAKFLIEPGDARTAVMDSAATQASTLESVADFSSANTTEMQKELPVLSTDGLEAQIFLSVRDKACGHDFHQTFLKCFNDSRRKDVDHGITTEQMQYTLKFKFHLLVNKADITSLFARHADEGTGRIALIRFVNYLVSTYGREDPLVDDGVFRVSEMLDAVAEDPTSIMPHILAKIRYSNTSRVLFCHCDNPVILFRKRLLDLINKHSKSPNYLLQTNQNLTRNQTQAFLLSKLNLSATEEMLTEISRYYSVHHNRCLIDVRRLLNNALSKTLDTHKLTKWRQRRFDKALANHPTRVSPDLYIFGTKSEDTQPPIDQHRNADFSNCTAQSSEGDRTELPETQIGNNAFVAISELPISLKSTCTSKQDIVELLYTKLVAKCRTSSPLSVLHLLFEKDVTDPKYSTKRKLRQVLQIYDIIVSNEEFEAFFEDFDIKDGSDRFEIRRFLLALFPSDYDNRTEDSNLFSTLGVTRSATQISRQEELMGSTKIALAKDAQEMHLLSKHMMTSAGLDEYDINSKYGTVDIHGAAQTQTAGLTMAWMFAGQPGNGPQEWAVSRHARAVSLDQRPKSASLFCKPDSRDSSRAHEPSEDQQELSPVALVIVGSRSSSAAFSTAATQHYRESPVRPTTAPPSGSRSSKRSSPLITSRIKDVV